jgi:hypothetical protein
MKCGNPVCPLVDHIWAKTGDVLVVDIRPHGIHLQERTW